MQGISTLRWLLEDRAGTKDPYPLSHVAGQWIATFFFGIPAKGAWIQGSPHKWKEEPTNVGKMAYSKSDP